MALPTLVSGLGRAPINCCVINLCFSPRPPSIVAIGIMGLGRNSRKIFGFKGLKGKIFRNKDLAPKTTPKMDLQQLRWAVLVADTPRSCPNQVSIFARGGWAVCDGRHTWL